MAEISKPWTLADAQASNEKPAEAATPETTTGPWTMKMNFEGVGGNCPEPTLYPDL